MKTIFDKTTAQQLIERANKIKENDKALWGKMNAYQMMKHCVKSERMYLQEDKYKRLFIGKLFGGMAKKGMLKNEEPLKKNQPTHPTFVIKGNGDFNKVKNEWISYLKMYNDLHESAFTGFVHPFFGAMNKTQLGQSVFKHTDHHLRQFGV